MSSGSSNLKRRNGEHDILRFVKRCRVSSRDGDGIEHAVELEASSLYEAVGLAIDRFRRCEHVKYEPQGFHEFIIEPRELSSEHRVTRKTFDEWLRRPLRSPADVILKNRLFEGTPGRCTIIPQPSRPHEQRVPAADGNGQDWPADQRGTLMKRHLHRVRYCLSRRLPAHQGSNVPIFLSSSVR